MSRDRELEKILEAILFSSPQVLTLRQMAEMMDIEESRSLRQHIASLNEQYEKTGRTFQIKEVAGGFQLRTDPKFHPWIQRLEPIKPIKLTLPTIETLAIVAYKQPVTRAGVEFIRGVDSSYTLRTLMKRRLIKVVGKESIPGRPILYGTTKTFLEVFGLKNINNLPSLKDLDMNKEETPPADEPATTDTEDDKVVTLPQTHELPQEPSPKPPSVEQVELPHLNTLEEE